MNVTEIDLKLNQLKSELELKYSVNKIGYFGSYAKNLQNENSDLDVIVEFSNPIGWAFFDVKDLLESELKLKVDLVTINSLKPQLKDKILSEVRYV